MRTLLRIVATMNFILAIFLYSGYTTQKEFNSALWNLITGIYCFQLSDRKPEE